jgi:penicillin-binding protein 1A
LAGLVQAPGRYDPRSQPGKALARRHYVLSRMLEDGFIDEAAFRQAGAAPLGVREHYDVNREAAPDFVEQVRRILMKKYGAERVLKEGWRVTTTCDLRLQRLAREAVRRGLRAHAKRQGLLALPDSVPIADWPKHRQAFQRRNQGLGADDVREGLVVAADDGGVRVDLGTPTVQVSAAQMKWVNKVQRGDAAAAAAGRRPGQILRSGDRVLVYKEGGDYVLAAWPAAEGALISMDVEDRAVLALIGGKDFEGSEFNRALQARRQPGSAFKPIVYAAALNAGLTPATVFADTALVFADNWRPANYDHVFRGYMTLRQALTHSVNTVTIRVAEMIGVDYLARFARRLGMRSIRGGDLSMAIGTYEVTPIELVNAYTVFATGGRLGDPIFIRRIVDRDGNLIDEAQVSAFVEQAAPMEGVPDLRHRGVIDQPAATVAAAQDERLQEFLRSLGVGGQKTPTPTPEPEPTPESRGEIPAAALQQGGAIWRQVLDPQAAYVITSMMHSVATEGTGAKSNVLKRTLAGKTGTTSDYKDAWFVGFSPQVIAGVWIGFDKGVNVLGGGESGSTTALPIWIEYMKAALEDQPNTPFVQPSGLVVARVDPQTGLLAAPDSPGVSEIFVPGTEPTEYAPAAASPLPQEFFNQELGRD